MEERYALLAEDSVKARFDALEQMLLEGLEMVDVQSAAQSAQREDYEKLYRESAIKKQIEYLQKELDAMHPENVSEIRRLELKLEEAGMNETALKEGRKVLNRLKGEGSNSPEAGMLTDWLDLLTALPWKKAEAREISMEEARKALNAEHSGLDKVKRRILQQIAVLRLKGRQSGSILCFVGAPGTGKTSIGESIAKALGREYVRVSLGGVRDEADIRGHRRTYIGSMPGRIIDGIHKCGTSNPVMVLDEVDKLSASYNGDPASALLEVLDPEQNFSFTDHYLNVPFDLSDVLFICTANTLDTIPEPLLNRMEVIQFQGYSPLEKHQIAREHLLPKAMSAVGIPEGKLSVSDEAIDRVIEEYTREAGVRQLERVIASLCRKSVLAILNHEKTTVTVTKKLINTWLGKEMFEYGTKEKKDQVGVVTGLAYTEFGGDVLSIEVNYFEGKGALIMTGQLGDVMKESASIALDYVKAHAKELKIDPAFFDKHDIHIHVPEGAVPKDGPSAGVTMTTALVSALSNTAVHSDLAMTGEVTLRGNVLPIGGLREKSLAAHRVGISTILIPKNNLRDLDEIPEAVKNDIKFIPVENVSQVLKEALVK